MAASGPQTQSAAAGAARHDGQADDEAEAALDAAQVGKLRGPRLMSPGVGLDLADLAERAQGPTAEESICDI